MLQKLLIRNYAIIEELDVELFARLNVITGETGAGKSIIVGALGLILGDRADSSVLLNKGKKCIVEGTFTPTNKKKVGVFLDSQDIEDADELIIRREISSNGKSRAFVNDTPVNLSQLHHLSSLLVDLHQQFDSLQLGETDFQREVLDALAGQVTKVKEYAALFAKWQLLVRETEELKIQQQIFDKDTDYNAFQIKELEEINLKENELEEIELQLKLLSNAEAIRAVLNNIYFELNDKEEPLTGKLKNLYNQLHHYQDYHPDLPALAERLRSAQIELADIATETESVNNHVNYEPGKIDRLNERLSLGYRLQKKHGVRSTNDLLEIQKQLQVKIQAVSDIGGLITTKQNEADQLWKEVKKTAALITDKRIKQVKPFEQVVNGLLKQVGMPNARIRIIVSRGEPTPYGEDKIDFQFNGNVPAGINASQADFLSLRKVASGGELSRVMLCIKSLVATSIDLPTLIFDEIDSGISGEAARQVGVILKELAMQRQVVCITHQPQIAGKADAHFFVYKETMKDSIRANIRKLSTDERIRTIATMLSGEKPTAAALENAKEMLMP